MTPARVTFARCAMVFATGCAAAPPVATLPDLVPADQVLPLMASRRPARFKMVHQVAAHFHGETHVMVGYLLGRADGALRVSASAAIGPRLFDVVKVDGRVDARTWLPQLEGKLDPRFVARAIELVYFVDCLPGAEVVSAEPPVYRYRCAVASQGDDLDHLDLAVDGRTLSPVSKVFSHGGETRVTASYEDVRPRSGAWLASRVHLAHTTGPSIDIALIEYHAPADFGDDAFVLPPKEPASTP